MIEVIIGILVAGALAVGFILGRKDAAKIAVSMLLFQQNWELEQKALAERVAAEEKETVALYGHIQRVEQQQFAGTTNKLDEVRELMERTIHPPVHQSKETRREDQD